MREVAQLCEARGYGVRIFGDEFGVLLEASTGVEEARQVAERNREGLQVPFNINGQEVFLKASIGIASDEADANKPERS